MRLIPKFLLLASTAVLSFPTFASHEVDGAEPRKKRYRADLDLGEQQALTIKDEITQQHPSLADKVKEYPMRHLSFVWAQMQELGVWEKCHDERHMGQILTLLKNYSKRHLIEVCKCMKSTGIIGKCQDGQQVHTILYTLEEYSILGLEVIGAWIKKNQILIKCQDGWEINRILRILTDYKFKKLATASNHMKALGAWIKCQNGWHIYQILTVLENYPQNKLTKVCAWIKASGALDKCQSGWDLSKLLGALEDYPIKTLNKVGTWMKASGAWDKCHDGWEISCLLENMMKCSQKTLTTLSKWMKTSGVWDKCQNGEQINAALCMLMNFQGMSYVDTLLESGILDQAFLHQCLLNASQRRSPLVQSILNQKYGLVDFDSNTKLYLLYHAYYRPHPAVVEAVKERIHNPFTRDSIIEDIVKTLGAEHVLTQEFLQLAIGYDIQADPDGFLAVHQEMITKSQQPVIHNPTSLTPGVVLNVEALRQPRPEAPIHMPVNVWHRLFEQLDQMEPQERQAHEHILGDESWEKLAELKHNHILTSLLDPENSLEVSQNVSSYSQMLRGVIQNIQQTQNIGAFLQLLINITTCKTGKMNGIMHSHILLSQGRVLDESDLGWEKFKAEIVDFLQEEFRRFRLSSLTSVAKSITDRADPHELYYIRGILGHEIGLMFQNERPSLDMNGACVSEDMRKQSKQTLLDLFYQYYKADDLIDRFHAMLNNGSLKIADKNGKQDLTITIINAFLQADAMDEEMTMFAPSMVVLDEKGSPIGLTPLAAKSLLLMMGFLKESDAQPMEMDE